jgi:ABC-type lipoprotein export system ATPase subunit
MSIALEGSTWKKWDLHVHTPESLVHNYPGDNAAAWDAFIRDLETLPPEFKVIGINDYLFVDGYERILREKRTGRLANIELILPVVELRLDKFGGVVERGADGKYLSSSWSRINLHVIFDQVEPGFIRDQFLSAITASYTLIPGAAVGLGCWGGVINRENLASLGAAIINSVPENQRARYKSPIVEGFNNLNISLEALKRALENPMLAGKHLVAIGKTEWDSLKWDDHTIAEKKSLINEANLVFTAAESPEAHERARRKLSEACVNPALLDCSDSHHLSNSDQKDRIGNCFTWIKADSTFQGLVQALQEFDDRVYVGDMPPKRRKVEQSKTKFIGSIKVSKKQCSALRQEWFNLEIPLNPDLVAIIGNKGSGKSALSDIVALAGNTRHHGKFSFLKNTRFRNPKTKFADHFDASLLWLDDVVSKCELDKDPDPTAVERVKYLPQSYLEDLCNELGTGGSITFDAELRKIIYSHVPDADRLGKASMNDLLDFKVAEIETALEAIRKKLSRINAEIIDKENRSTPEFIRALQGQLEAKNAELVSLESVRPAEIEDPNESEEALEDTKNASSIVDSFEQMAEAIDTEEKTLKEQKSVLSKREALARRIAASLLNYKKQHDVFLAELRGLLAEMDVELPIEALIELHLDGQPIEQLSSSAKRDLVNVDARLGSQADGSIFQRRQANASALAEAKERLGEPQRQFVRYKEELAAWEKARAEVIGSPEKIGSIKQIEAEIKAIEVLPSHLEHLRGQRSNIVKDIHGQIQDMVNEYSRLYYPVQEFVVSDEQREMNLPLDFQVQIEESGFSGQLLLNINQRVRGSFMGVDDSAQTLLALIQEADFSSPDGAVAFANLIDTMLRADLRDGQNGRATILEHQLAKGSSALELLNFVFGLDYLNPRYSLTYKGQEIGQLSPGDRGLLLLVFYLLVDKDDIPIVIDQPEENLDNQTIFKVLVKCIKRAKQRRQVIMVTHNPNLAVVCDAEQIIYAACDKVASRFTYESGAIENPAIRSRVVEILEGTEPAFRNRQDKYRLG